ncbi:twin-arginine translocation signal domain-containing protein [Puteibacter caeruleilacunae]|nr:twin-arginine translocation signal domain-containing protein [Puteibacter caeruleilacunae]
MTDKHNSTRRSFLKKSAITAGAFAAGPTIAMAGEKKDKKKRKKRKSKNPEPFKLKYAPHPGMFKHSAGDNMLDQIKFCADQGFRAWFDNGIMNRPVSEQEQIAKTLADLNMELGPFVLYADFKVESFVTQDESIIKMLKDKMRQGVETAKRVNAKTTLVVPGRYSQKLHWDYQTANVIDNLKRCSEIMEPAGLTMVLEPLNALTNHPGLFLTTIPQSYMICRAVNSPSCKIVNDLYHQQITEGQLIPNIDYAYDEIGAFHLGDNPGRKEPLTGEINFKNIFKHIYHKGYDGVLCMEHGKSLGGIEGEEKLLAAYRACDDFEIS